MDRHDSTGAGTGPKRSDRGTISQYERVGVMAKVGSPPSFCRGERVDFQFRNSRTGSFEPPNTKLFSKTLRTIGSVRGLNRRTISSRLPSSVFTKSVSHSQKNPRKVSRRIDGHFAQPKVWVGNIHRIEREAARGQGQCSIERIDARAPTSDRRLDR